MYAMRRCCTHVREVAGMHGLYCYQFYIWLAYQPFFVFFAVLMYGISLVILVPQVNHAPSFNQDSPLDRTIKEGVVFHAMQMMNITVQERRLIEEEHKVPPHCTVSFGCVFIGVNIRTQTHKASRLRNVIFFSRASTAMTYTHKCSMFTLY